MSTLRIGLSMRRQYVEEYGETRDALDRQWGAFMREALPGVPWMPVPNVGDDVAAFIDQWGLNGFILTGGDSIGDDPMRDATETGIVNYALANKLPVLGVCRGMQFLCQHLGAMLMRVDGHCAQCHDLRITSDFIEYPEKTIETNSFHEWGVRGDVFPESIEPLAVDQCGGMEAFIGRNNRLMGFMWHPERKNGAHSFSEACVRKLFLSEI